MKNSSKYWNAGQALPIKTQTFQKAWTNMQYSRDLNALLKSAA